jgi:hypothetical protein
MKIWVDADACPGAIKEILYRAAERKKIALTLVANQALKIPGSNFIRCLQVRAGFDEADDEIVRRMGPGDLIITADIPLAAEVINQKGFALSPRGELFQESTIEARLTMRDFLETMRSAGEHTGGPPPLNHNDRKAFADQLDKLIQKQIG